MATVFKNFQQAVQQAGSMGDDNCLWVDGGRDDTYVADGSLLLPYKTLNAAVSAITTTKTTLMVLPATYTLTATLTMPDYGVFIYGVGPTNAVVIEAAAAVTPLITIAPTSAVTTTTWYEFHNLYINNTETSQIGIQLDNANCLMGGAAKLYLKLVHCEIGDGGAAVDSDHGYATSAIRINMEGTYIEGAMNFDIGHTGDRLKCNWCTIEGLVTAQGDDIASEWTFLGCRSLDSGSAFAGGQSTNVINMLGCYTSADAAVATGDIGGSFSENIVA